MEGTHVISMELIDIPEQRWRPVKKKVEDIAQSLLVHGQLQPIILRRDGERYALVDGLHRYTAAGMNAQQNIEAIFTTELDPIKLREIELEVNIMRVEMDWQEKQLAIAELHAMKMEHDPTWTQESTAATIEASQPKVAKALRYAEMVKIFPELAKAKSMSQAESWMTQRAKLVTRTVAVNEDPKYDDIEAKIILGDSVEVIKDVPDASFRLVLTDPPFGIGYEHRKAGTEGSISAYEDSEESYTRLLSMAPDLYRVIKRDGWLVWFLGISWYERAKVAFREAGFLVDEIPIIWDRSDGRCFTSRPDRYFARGYDIALHCIKGDPEVVIRGKPNVLRFEPIGTTERELLVERPVTLYEELIRRLTVKGECVADFFVGSGSCPAAAAMMQRDFFGVEIDQQRRATAIKKINAYIPVKGSRGGGLV